MASWWVSTFAAMADGSDPCVHALGCTLVVSIGLAVNAFFNHLAPASCRKDVFGSPLYSWRIGVIHQVILFPTCFLLAVCSTKTPLPTWSAWLNATWAELGTPWHALFHYIFFGYVAKDMTIPMALATQAHHMLCICLVVLSLLEWPQPCSATFIAMSTILETGSCALSMNRQYPASRLLSTASLLVMSLSNAAASALALWYGAYFRHPTGHGETIAGRWALPGVGFVLFYMRQDMEWKRWRSDHRKTQ